MATPHPRPEGQRQARPGRDIPWTDIEDAPRPGKAPAVPKWASLSSSARAWWAWAWKLPVARMWGDHELPMVVRRAQLEAVWQETRDEKLLTEIRHLEAALGLTAKARKELRWRLVKPEAAGGSRSGSASGRGRGRLRVVDGQAS